MPSQPIKSLDDPRIKRAKEALEFFEKWESSVWSSNLGKDDKPRALLSQQCREDLSSTIVGFEQLVYQRLKLFPGSSILPYLVNSDICENIFCQVRSTQLGPTTHPNVSQYTHALTSIILSQGLLSIHGNASNNTFVASPFQFHTNQPLRKYKRKNKKR